MELAMAAGLLLIPVALVVMSLGPWSESRVDAEALASEAARAAVLDLNVAAGTGQVMAALTTLDLAAEGIRIGWCGTEPQPLATAPGTCGFSRGSVVSVTVQVWTPLIATPWGAVGGLWVAGEHTEPMDLYRSLG
ncbi:MAG TPA: hypothetical protein VFP42_00795 [Acidimicrobiia bacterium]|nr:hypothetical protein [Acidimicrobiia bacterium]